MCRTQCMHSFVHHGTHVEIRGQLCGVCSLFLLLDSKNQSQVTKVISEAPFLTESSHWLNYGFSKCNYWLCSPVSLWRSCLWFRWCLSRWPLVTSNICYSAYVGLIALSPQLPLPLLWQPARAVGLIGIFCFGNCKAEVRKLVQGHTVIKGARIPSRKRTRSQPPDSPAPVPTRASSEHTWTRAADKHGFALHHCFPIKNRTFKFI